MSTSGLSSEATATSLPITMLLLWYMTKDELHHVHPLKQVICQCLLPWRDWVTIFFWKIIHLLITNWRTDPLHVR
jgi:hypothetical protein